MTDDKKPRELTHESIQWVPKKAYAALADENKKLREALEKIDKNDERFSGITHKRIARDSLRKVELNRK